MCFPSEEQGPSLRGECVFRGCYSQGPPRGAGPLVPALPPRLAAAPGPPRPIAVPPAPT